jgi:hypothetical protein
VSRPKIAIGFAVLLVVFQIIGQPHVWVWLPLLLCSVFLMFWGIAPEETRRFVTSLPFGPRLWRSLAAVEDRISWDARRKARTRIEVAEFIETGGHVLNRCYDESQDAPVNEAQAWLDEVIIYIRESQELGPSYIPRFQNPHGIPAPQFPVTLAPERLQLVTAISFRLARLEQFLQELSAG